VPRQKKRAPAEGTQRVTAAELARLYGVSDQAVSGWKSAGAPFGPDRRISLAEFRRWEHHAIKSQAEAKAAPTTEDEARARKLSAEAELAEVKLARERGQVVAVEDAAGAYERRVTRLRQAVAAIPGTYAQQIVGLETTGDAMRVLRDVTASLLAALQPEAA
jgi:phage terminase Nu1 subunit (DNA packaging protein)